MIGSMLVGKLEQKSIIRVKNINDFENYFNAIDVDYDCEHVIFTGRLYILNTPDFFKLNGSQYARSTDFKQDIVEFIGNNCFIRTSGNCFIKCINYLTGKEYLIEFLTFIRDEQRRSNVMTSAKVQLLCKKHSINLGCYDGCRVCRRTITETKIAFFCTKTTSVFFGN